MITVTEYSGQSVGVFGLGKAGEATIASLKAGGAVIHAWDDASSSSLATRHYNEWPWHEIKALVLSPGVPLTHPKPHEVVTLAKQYNVPIIGDIELLYRAHPDASYVAITGTNGKSTTTTLIAHILKTAGIRTEVGGNLGTAALALAPLGKDGVYVIETSSYQLDLLHTARFNVACFLNITPDHLDRHGDMQGYIAAKMHIFDRQTSEDTAVIAVDDRFTVGIRDWALATGGRKVIEVSSYQPIALGISTYDGNLHDHSSLMPRPKAPMPLDSIPTLPGRHNWQNAAVAYGAARALGIAPEVIYGAMQSFGGLRHRLQMVAYIRGVRFINDSKATNADATSNALAPYENIYWILGGKAKAGGIETLGEYFPKIAHAFLIGAAQEEFAATLEGKVAYTCCGTLAVAVQKAAEMAWQEQKNNAVVLLSPACASFDQWKSFEHRGDAFCEMVERLNITKEAS